MRKIIQVDIVTAQGAKTYSIGNKINNLVIADFTLSADEGLMEIVARDKEGKLVADIINCPVVIEYAEVAE